jgi:hypothetical protein
MRTIKVKFKCPEGISSPSLDSGETATIRPPSSDIPEGVSHKLIAAATESGTQPTRVGRGPYRGNKAGSMEQTRDPTTSKLL